MVGAADAGQQIMIGVLMLSSLLNVAYLLPLVGKGFFLPAKEEDPLKDSGFKEAPLFVVAPPVLTAFGCLILFLYAGGVQDFLWPITGVPHGQ